MKRLLKFPIFAMTALIIFITACKKDNITPLDMLNSSPTSSHVFNVGGSNNISLRAGEEDPAPTLLGEIRDNPYTVSKMTEAYNNINAISIGQVSTTNLYVKFCPNNVDELLVLINEGLELLDFPMEYEVLEMGDYYDDPNIPEGELPCYYTVVEPNYVFPAVPYVILESLHIADYDSPLAEEAFKLTGQEYDGNKNLCTDTDPNWPECQCDIYLNINQVEWQTCIDAVRNPPTGHSTCPTISDWRRPGGKIQIEDTQLGLEGVKKAKVVWWNGWFTVKTTHTDDNGCWSLNTQESGKAYMWVKFKNEKATIRTIRLNKFHQYLFAVTDYVGIIASPPYNDIEVNYLDHPNVDSQPKRYWVSATTLNAVDDFYDYANQDVFLTPPEDLNILLHTFGAAGVGGAPMLQYALQDISQLSDLLQGVFMTDFSWGTSGESLMSVFEQTMPDITYSYFNTPSDQVKETIYHELAHASHFGLVGNYYWSKLRWHIIANGGYGNPTSPAAGSAFGRVAVSEAWGFHIGPVFTERQYGLNHSNTTNPTLIERKRHLNLLENRQWASGFIPRGLMLDLIDDNSNDYPSGTNYENSSVMDNTVSGFTNAVIFNNIGASITNLAEFEGALSSVLPPGVTAANLAALFAQY